MRQQVVVVGAGMVGHRFVEELVARDREQRFDVHLVGAEEYEPYNRILLTEVLARRCDVAALTLPRPPERVEVRRGALAVAIDREAGVVRLEDGGELAFDHVVLATGATAFVPPLLGLVGQEGPDGWQPPRHVHVLRTIDDCRDVVARTVNARHAVVLGGGVLGIEAACGLARRGLAVTVVHLDGHLMAEQLDPPAGEVLARRLDALGIRSITSTSVAEVIGAYGELVAVRLTDGSVLATDLMLVSCGVRPETSLAAGADLPIGRGVVVDAALTSPADRRVHAIGDCAEPPEGVSGLVAPGWAQAARLAATLVGGSTEDVGNGPQASPESGPESGPGAGIHLKAHGVDLVTRGLRGSTATSADRVLCLSDPQAGRHVEVVVRGETLAGFTALGSPQVSASLASAFDRRTPLPLDPAALLVPAAGPAPRGTPTEASPTLIPADATICRCNGVTKSDIIRAWDAGCSTVEEVAASTRATTGCGGCTDSVCGIVDWLTSSEGGGESTPQPVRNKRGQTVAATKHQSPLGEMQRS